MSFNAYGPRASPPAEAVAATRRCPQRRPHRGLGLALLCLLCYSLLRAAQGAWWAASLRRSGPCQADNEVCYHSVCCQCNTPRVAHSMTLHPLAAGFLEHRHLQGTLTSAAAAAGAV